MFYRDPYDYDEGRGRGEETWYYDPQRGWVRGDPRGDPRWERTRMWRRDQPGYRSGDPYDYDQGNRSRRGEDETRYGSRRNRYEDEFDPYNNRDENRFYGYGRGFSEGYSRDYRRDEDYGSGQDYNRYRGYDRDWNRGPSAYRHSTYRPSAFPSAGMGADFSGNVDYDHYDDEDEDLNYGEGDIGYESEGAFYQDLDEPENFNNQNYWSGPGRGTFNGIGPLGYQRSDERITDDVCERLTRHGRVDARDINIEVKDGEVFLKGSVPSREMKRLAEDVADQVSGVKDVHNEIKVDRRVEQYQARGTRRESSSREPSSREPSSQEPSGHESSSGQELLGSERQRQAEYSPAGDTNLGSGLTTAGDISMPAVESAQAGHQKRSSVRVGMDVLGADGHFVGRVKTIREDDFLVDREMARDIYVPFSFVSNASEQVMLTLNTDEVDRQNWEKPALF